MYTEVQLAVNILPMVPLRPVSGLCPEELLDIGSELVLIPGEPKNYEGRRHFEVSNR